MYETQAIDFIQDTETREIKGVWAKQGETVIAIKARRAVVLATGSYTGSPELVKRFSRAGMFIPNYDSPHNTGDGIYMATRAGAQLWGFSSECLDFQDWAIKPASEEVGTGIRYLQPTEEAPGHIIVNKAGVRFMNELVNTRHTRAHMPVFGLGRLGARIHQQPLLDGLWPGLHGHAEDRRLRHHARGRPCLRHGSHLHLERRAQELPVEHGQQRRAREGVDRNRRDA